VGPLGKQTADLILDTGAEYCSISTGLARLLGYDVDRQCRWVTIITANGPVKVPSVLVAEIRVGDSYAHHVAVTCHDIPEVPEVFGFLGLNYLRRCRTVIDYRTRQISIRRIS
jgi:predicted aspartyl protease